MPSPGLLARLGKSIAKQSEGRAGEKYLPMGQPGEKVARNRGSTRLLFLLPPLAICSQGTIDGFERRGGIIFVEGVHRVLGIELVEGIVGVARVVLVHRIRGVAGIVLIDRVQRILRIVGVDRIKRIIGTLLVGLFEFIIVAFVLLREAGFGKRRDDGEVQRQDKEEDDPHGEPRNER
jgi:hypothetical protein